MVLPCSAEQMRDKVFSLLDNPAPFEKAISQFQMTGIRFMQERLKVFRGLEPINACEPAIKAESNKRIKEMAATGYMHKVV